MISDTMYPNSTEIDNEILVDHTNLTGYNVVFILVVPRDTAIGLAASYVSCWTAFGMSALSSIEVFTRHRDRVGRIGR